MTLIVKPTLVTDNSDNTITIPPSEGNAGIYYELNTNSRSRLLGFYFEIQANKVLTMDFEIRKYKSTSTAIANDGELLYSIRFSGNNSDDSTKIEDTENPIVVDFNGPILSDSGFTLQFFRRDSSAAGRARVKPETFTCFTDGGLG